MPGIETTSHAQASVKKPQMRGAPSAVSGAPQTRSFTSFLQPRSVKVLDGPRPGTADHSVESGISHRKGPDDSVDASDSDTQDDNPGFQADEIGVGAANAGDPADQPEFGAKAVPGGVSGAEAGDGSSLREGDMVERGDTSDLKSSNPEAFAGAVQRAGSVPGPAGGALATGASAANAGQHTAGAVLLWPQAQTVADNLAEVPDPDAPDAPPRSGTQSGDVPGVRQHGVLLRQMQTTAELPARQTLSAVQAQAFKADPEIAPLAMESAGMAVSEGVEGDSGLPKTLSQIAAPVLISSLAAASADDVSNGLAREGSPTADARHTTQTVADPRSAMANQASQTMHLIAARVAEVLGRNAERAFKVILEPSELGRVRIMLAQSETGMSVNVQAERGETVDLMRRNSDLLDREFRDLGYGGIDFSFSQDRGKDDDAPRQGSSDVVVSMPTDTLSDASPYLRRPPGHAIDRLDIRL